jgi:Na+/H+ antiporter NhaD/arsenite permease-like protein
VLFIGIFATMMPALDYLKGHAAELPRTPTLYYFGTGLLSSVLDNAPTYLGFLNAAAGPAIDDPARLMARLAEPEFVRVLIAVSVASVFFGACTYIGNGPNFMVKAIAEHEKVRVPGFLGYIVRFTLPFMVPMLLVVWWVFFRET